MACITMEEAVKALFQQGVIDRDEMRTTRHAEGH